MFPPWHGAGEMRLTPEAEVVSVEGRPMMKVILTEKRKDKLADYSLNISVASFAVAAFDGNWWGVLPAFLFLVVFFLLTQED